MIWVSFKDIVRVRTRFWGMARVKARLKDNAIFVIAF